MSEVVGEAVLRIRTDDSQVDRGVERAGKKAGEGYSKGFAGSVKDLAAIAAGSLVVDKVVSFTSRAISGASDLNETVSKTQVVFGKATASVLAFSDQGAKALGQSKQQVLDAASTFGIFGKAAGLSGQPLAKFSTQFTQLATDLASFHNTSPQEAIEAIGAALRGEAEPIRKYGVLLDDMSLRQEAVRQGLIKTTKTALTPQQKTLAASALIMAKTKNAQGDFARTSSGLANQQRILQASLEDTTTKFGSLLLPAVVKIVNFANTEVEPALDRFVTGFKNGTGAGGDFRDVLENTVHIGQGIIRFFDSLPGPVKKYGAELAIAAAVTSKLNSGLSVVTGGIGKYTSAIASAEGRQAKLTAGLQGLGTTLRNVGGAGGMLLVADGAQKAGTKMGILEGAAGGALSGAALGAFGGPPGAAIGAGIGALAGAALTLGHNTEAAGRNAKVAIPSYKEYASTLEGVAASTTRATREMVFQRLESSGLLESTRKLGLSDREAVNAVLGNHKARADMARALRNTNVLTKNQEAALEKETGALGASRLAQLKKNVALAGNKEELRKARKALRDFMAEPASKRVAITGVEGAKAQLRGLRLAIRQVWGAAKDLNTAGVGGIGTLLNPGGNAAGTPSWRGGWTKVGEMGEEMVNLPRGTRILTHAQTQQADARTAAAGPTGRTGPTYQIASLVVHNAVAEPASNLPRTLSNLNYLLGV